MNLGLQELLILAVLALLLFGAKRLPEVARALGQGVREFRRTTREVMEPVDEAKRMVDEGRKELVDNVLGGK